MNTRRNFLISGVAAAAAMAGVAGRPAVAAETEGGGGGGAVRPNRIAISTYSFWRFLDNSKVPIEECIRQSAAMGFDAVEILHIQMNGEENAYLQSLKRIAITEGVDLCGLSIHQGFVSPITRSSASSWRTSWASRRCA